MKRIVFSILTLWIAVSAFAFEGEVRNTLGEPLEMAFIENLSSGSHAHSSELGKFYLENTSAGDSIKVSYIGYKSQFVQLKQTNYVIFTLLETQIYLQELNINQKIDPLKLLSKVNSSNQNIQSAQEILGLVPGLIIGQHAGGGKAEQLFLRGFDIDHGTDIAISVDGIPVNLVSHAHGQGYADLHFVIPELIDQVEFVKGPHDASAGNLATAGSINIKTKNSIDNSIFSIEKGMYNSNRMLLIANLLKSESSQNAYVAIEHKTTDGPFESSQLFKRSNFVGKYTLFPSSKSKLSISATHFTSTWNASGQIPQRAVDNGTISRFGAIDDTEGGTTSRSNFNLQYFKQLNSSTYIKTNAFYTKSKFLLFSNFTFFLNDSINGDQIKQNENRDLYGAEMSLYKLKDIREFEVRFTNAIGFRQDNIADLELSHTANRRELINEIQRGKVYESNWYYFSQIEIEYKKWELVPSLRYDYFQFEYEDALADKYSHKAESEPIISPKLSLVYSLNNIKWYAKTSLGFHSNDSRLVNTVPNSILLAKAWGNDIGFIWKLSDNVLLSSTVWDLRSEQELVYVGDEGIVEPSNSAYRKGIDFGIKWQWNSYIVASTDITYSDARYNDIDESSAYVPLAPRMTGQFSLDLRNFKGFSSRLSMRYLSDRPATEDYSLIAKGYTVIDANIEYKFKRFITDISILNITNTQWNETQFATESKLQNEVRSVEEIHFTPGTPFYVQLGVSYLF